MRIPGAAVDQPDGIRQVIQPLQIPDCGLCRAFVKYLLVRRGAACRIYTMEALAGLSDFFTLLARIKACILLGSMEVIDC